MVGVPAIGICDAMEKSGEIPELKTIAEYTNLERLMLDAIIFECRGCISSAGQDCMTNGGAVCPFVEVRRTCGLFELKGGHKCE